MFVLKSKYPLILLFLMVLNNCTSSTDRVVLDYELKYNGIKVLEVIGRDKLIPFYAKDSIVILDTLYSVFYETKIKSLNKQLASIVERYDKATDELKAIDNTLMAKVFKSRIVIIEEERKRIKEIIDIYNECPEQTELNSFATKRDYYASTTNKIIGYTTTITFLGIQGYLAQKTFTNVYMFDANKDEIIGSYIISVK